MENSTLDTQSGNAENQENNSHFGDMSKNTLAYERTTIPNTPFVQHYSESHGWAMGIAEHKLTGWYKTEEELHSLLKGIKPNGDLDWEMITGVILILLEKVMEQKSLEAARHVDKLIEKTKNQNDQ